jgi:sigma-B regulation protein RsbU (phosphoserine phosphatase)
MAEERLKILLIEHDAGFTRAVGEMLGHSRDLAADLSTAADLHSGFSILNGNNYDVVVLDVSVPDGAGLANISLLKAEAPKLPIIAAGEADNETIAIEAVQAGAQDYLVKSQLTSGWLERSIRYAIERHRSDLALRPAEEKYHSIFDHLVEGIFRTTPDGHYLLANAALARIYGYSSPEDLVNSITDISRRLYVQEGRRDEFVRLMQEHDTIIDFESETYRKDGTTIWISENCRAIRDPQGNLLYYEGTVEDITLRSKAEENLRNSESLYHSLVENSPQNIFRKDIQGRFTFANQQYCKHYQCKLEDILGKTDFDFFPTELAEKYRRDDWRVLETGQTMHITEEHQPKGQEKSYVQVVKSPLYDANGRIIGLQGMFWDVTTQHLAEERVRKANAQLAQSRKELHEKNLQLEDDLKMAREIQLSMLPLTYPSFPRNMATDDSAFQFTHRYLPTSTVGGDFFTVSALSDTEAAVFICDVAGHGVRSALVTAMVRALVEELKPVAGDPGKFLTRLNQDLHSMLKHAGTPMLTTAFYLVANYETGTMRYSNAGHPKPLHVRRGTGRAEPLANAGGKSQSALGLFAETTYQTSEVRLTPRDFVMLFTDGLYEVEGANNELYSQTMLVADVQRRLALPATRLFDELLEQMRRFSVDGKFDDDVCLVGMEVVTLQGAEQGTFRQIEKDTLLNPGHE